jgi:hypothetical protein
MRKLCPVECMTAWAISKLMDERRLMISRQTKARSSGVDRRHEAMAATASEMTVSTVVNGYEISMSIPYGDVSSTTLCPSCRCPVSNSFPTSSLNAASPSAGAPSPYAFGCSGYALQKALSWIAWTARSRVSP